MLKPLLYPLQLQLIASGLKKPQISQHRDRQGNLYYQVYDALTAKPITVGSEMEIKWWLEQRHHN